MPPSCFFPIWPPKPPKPGYIRFGSPSSPVECGHEPKKYPAIQKSATICHPHGARSIMSRALQYEEGFKSARSQKGTHPRPMESETVHIKIIRLQINPTMNCQFSSRGPFAIHGNPPPIGITLKCAIIAHDQQCTIFIESDPSQ